MSTEKSSRPIWLGEINDKRKWDHVRVHIQLMLDPRFDTSHPDRLSESDAVWAGVSKTACLAVYLSIVMHAEIRTGAARPSADTLAQYAGCDPKTARRACRLLEHLGYLEIEERKGMAPVFWVGPPPTLPMSTDVDTGGRFPHLASDRRAPRAPAARASGTSGDEQDLERENPPSPQPPPSAGEPMASQPQGQDHSGQHANCRACGTNPRGRRPETADAAVCGECGGRFYPGSGWVHDSACSERPVAAS